MIRFTVASAIYLPVLIYLRRHKKIAARDHLKIFLLGFMIIPLNQVIFLVGQSMTLAGHGALLFATVPIFIYLLAVIF